jgi:hypothetical protein
VAGEPQQQPVPVGDLEIAQRIASAARSGGRAEREPTLEQLLSAFGEAEPTPEARARIASALTLAGVRTTPTVHEAHPGERLKLRPPNTGGPGRLALAVGALALVIGAAAAVAAVSTGGGGDHHENAAGVLPAAEQTTPTTTTQTAPPTTATTPTANPKKKAAAKKKAKKKRKPAPPKQVVVRLVPTDQASYLCVDHGPGTQTTETTLSSPLTFKGKRVRLNVGLSSVRVTVNGKPFQLAFSPSGYDLQPTKRSFLPQGQRPCA